ncbi:1-deoxy-D-xylulose-5-phosphate reductoisomerase [Pseudoprimorskyibacter insulae]|uniref:1-deoxy-D-xylulose 5-phosphate reductoisomerase n=1 Tax=Pseudoprimorskyibacter insulae TaxID=1695997 RepID=A0A2R8AWF8_9RHOB|nr:1-deoxy-D-xylulose-5-phosphate reductoisomerase [Pseudoprimorskyibacter insulae]SPF80370.1 1-deoxy-D-xylulose 5-phosphate reductoisomerase [Pseudoprimorskyibacter insulae]
MKRISIFGATGSIGQNTIDLIRRAPGDYEVVALSGGRNVARLAQDARDLNAKVAVTAFDDCLAELREALAGTGIEAASGTEALRDAADRPADWVMSSIIGAAGLEPGLRALHQGAQLALANKESLVCAGPLVMQTARDHNTQVLPVDSEHSAVFQALIGEDISAVERVVITASGGAFRDWPEEDLAKATPEQAATHPNWDMGQRITIDSASMFNKALELIETHEFFGFAPSMIETVVHPESLIHALVGFRDGALMAHVGAPDMRHAIGFALHFPDRRDLPVARLDLTQVSQMTFRPACERRWPALRLARAVMEAGGLSGAVFNAAKERALDAFIEKRIGFQDMARVVEAVLDRLWADQGLTRDQITLDTVAAADHLARRTADEVISEF